MVAVANQNDHLQKLSMALHAVFAARDQTAAVMMLAPEVGLTDFDWMRWPDRHRYIQQPDLIAQADELTCRRVLTTLIRGERFNEGMIEEALARGVLAALAARVRQLAGPEAAPV